MKPSSSKTAGKLHLDRKRTRLALLTVAILLVVDQVSKIWVKTHMYLDESIVVFPNWFFIHFIENPGMAFGFEFGGSMGKLFLSLFRIVAIGFFAWYLRSLVKTKAHQGLIFSVALVVAGAAGNMIDSAFYGIIFGESPRFTPEVAQMFPPDGGYAGFLFGKVVDMFYFPIIDGTLPEWLPVWGGERFQFFRPVFNVADSAITVGMALILINQKRFFKQNVDKESPEVSDSGDELQGPENRE